MLKGVYSYYTNDRILADKISTFCKRMKISYERSGCFDGCYFSMNLDKDEYETVNGFIDENA